MCNYNPDNSGKEAIIVASPDGLAELLDAVDKALSHPEGRSSVEMHFSNGEEFTLHIIRQHVPNPTLEKI